MTVIGGAAGREPVAPLQAQAIRRSNLLRRIADGGRAHEEGAWRIGGRIAVLLPLAALVFAVSVLAVKAYPAVRVNGLNFLTGTKWIYGSGYAATVHTDGVAHPAGASFGALSIIVGTLQSSAIALIIAVPISVGTAFALTERMPTWLSRPLGFAIEVLAGIPSVVIGLWGLLILAPLLAGCLPCHWPQHARCARTRFLPWQAHSDGSRVTHSRSRSRAHDHPDHRLDNA